MGYTGAYCDTRTFCDHFSTKWFTRFLQQFALRVVRMEAALLRSLVDAEPDISMTNATNVGTLFHLGRFYRFQFCFVS